MGIKEIQLSIEIMETVEELRKRPPDAIATALVFVISELMVLRGDTDPDKLEELVLQAGKEAITLTDGVFLATPPHSTETIH
jgi:hypothetical protein